MKTFHVDEPREIGKKKTRLSSKEFKMVKNDLSERIGITSEQAKVIKDNLCIFCGVPTNEDLRKWFGKGGAVEQPVVVGIDILLLEKIRKMW